MDYSFRAFLEGVSSSPILCITVLFTLGVIFVNGWTDAPNAIATCITTRCMRVRSAILMSKKQDSFYFQNFMDCADCSRRAAYFLRDTLEHFDATALKEKLDEMHKIEHAGDSKKHELINTLVKAFITPIDREDLVQISQNMDDLTDKIEDVLIRIYYNHISDIREDAFQMVDVLIRCCEEICLLMEEFPHFKHSKKLHECIVRINSLEEESDELFISCMYRLHGTNIDPLHILVWREIYLYLEKCADTCEHIADIVESVVMKNR